MRLLLTSVVMLILPAVASRASDGPAPLDFLTPADLASHATAVEGPGGQPAIEVTGAAGGSTTTIIVRDDPSISADRYAVRGRVKYEGVAGDGYLELWSHFGPQARFFTRTLGDWGRMKKLRGTSDWRDFELPFNAKPGMRPQKLTLNVVLPGAGKVTVAQPVLVSLDVAGQWWTEPQAGLIGGVLGSFVGILGALVGIFAAWRKSRPLSLALFGLGLAIGGAALLAGTIAICVSQPWHVYYPLLLIGFICTAVFGGNLWMMLQRIQADELRRITAVDA